MLSFIWTLGTPEKTSAKTQVARVKQRETLPKSVYLPHTLPRTIDLEPSPLHDRISKLCPVGNDPRAIGNSIATAYTELWEWHK